MAHTVKKKGPSFRIIFLGSVIIVYLILFLVSPERARLCLASSMRIFRTISFPICMVFCLMILLNHFLKASHVVRLLGKKGGIKGALLSAAAGIISFGPIYAWYPLLKELKGKGAGNRNIALFLSNRAIKPFLLPLMISYFGWIYVLLLTIFMMAGSIAVAHFVDRACAYKTKEISAEL